MTDMKPGQGPILRLFQVKVRKGAADKLLDLFATTSADVVRGEPGNAGYFFGRSIAVDDDQLLFTSVWKDLDAVKRRFGEDWQQSYLPEGYADLIEQCSVQHVDISNGWFVKWGQ